MESISPQDQNSQTAKAQEKRDGALAFWHSDLLEANLSVYDRAVYTDLVMGITPKSASPFSLPYGK
jgi:hypothetical protein